MKTGSSSYSDQFTPSTLDVVNSRYIGYIVDMSGSVRCMRPRGYMRHFLSCNHAAALTNAHRTNDITY